MKTSNKQSHHTASFANILFLGVAIILGGHYSYWNIGLEINFWEYLGSILFMGSGYLCLSLCLCEMTSAMPFSGGTYGLARVTLGKFPAFLMGTCEYIEYLNCTAFAMEISGEMVSTLIYGTPDCHLQPLFWFIFYLYLVCWQLTPRKVFWWYMSLLGLFVIVMLTIYCVLSPLHANFNQHITHQPHMNHDSAHSHTYQSFRVLPFASWFFMGLETVPLTAGNLCCFLRSCQFTYYIISQEMHFSQTNQFQKQFVPSL